ncbi:MAG: HEPN domain-containing protein [Candidatus Symbiothrix sp.]|jgi:HEPN domain-containing protein|nr:HEPN domain-containing protein [Candidatus Symbiothrix sp.]
MTGEEKIKYWLDLSDSDLAVADTMLTNKHYLYVGLMCHQVIEKIFKGYYTALLDKTPPFTHELPYPAQKGGFYEILSEEQQLFLDRLNPLNVRTCYPDYKDNLAKIANACPM